MEYMKHLLNKEKVKLGEFEAFAKMFEMVSNQQELKAIGKEFMKIIKSLEGEVSLLHYVDGKFLPVATLGDKDKIESYLLEKDVLKAVKESKKPHFDSMTDKRVENYFNVLPILSKDEFLGALCIHKEQEIGCWKEIHMLLHMMSVVFKHYRLIEITKNVNIQDVVTDLFNYRHFQDQLDLEIEKSLRYHIPLSLVLFDIENFKKINEKLGFDAGDDVLKQVAAWIKSQCRRVDMPARLDADTFAVLLSSTDVKGAEALMSRIIMRSERHSIDAGGKTFKVKLKTSVVGFEADYTKEQFLELAKRGLN